MAGKATPRPGFQPQWQGSSCISRDIRATPGQGCVVPSIALAAQAVLDGAEVPCYYVRLCPFCIALLRLMVLRVLLVRCAHVLFAAMFVLMHAPSLLPHHAPMTMEPHQRPICTVCGSV
jgi:hypothetical protein